MTHVFFKELGDWRGEVERLVRLLVQDRSSSSGGGGLRVVTRCHEVWPVVQKGPMCGLVALSMAAGLLLTHSTTATTEPHHPERVLEYGVRNHLTRRGEVFSCESLREIAQSHLSLPARVIDMDTYPTALRDLLVGIVSGHEAILVPYDADKDHSPCLARGHSAHWCLLVGVCLLLGETHPPRGVSGTLARQLLDCCQDSRDNHHMVREGNVKEFSRLLEEMAKSREILAGDWIYVFARQGKSAHMGLWSLRALLDSNGNLTEVDPQRSDPQEYVIPEGGVREGLRNKVVFVTKTLDS